jgi:hypothetical protein
MKIYRLCVALLISAITLCGCGFKPVHQQGRVDLLPIKVVKLEFAKHQPNKFHYDVMQCFRQEFDTNAAELYALEVVIHKSITSFAHAEKNIGTSNKILLTARFTLKDMHGKLVMSESATASGNASLSSSPYAGFVTDEDVTISIAKSLVQQIIGRCRLALLTQHSTSVGG